MDESKAMVCVAHEGLAAETPKACCFRIKVDLGFGDPSVQEQWVPKSLMEHYDDREFWVQAWFADKEGLNYV